LAAKATSQELKGTLLDLAKTWAKLAAELETSHALHDMLEPTSKKVH
jgi:hypothetical protein